ncbi:MAG: hypothetical protein ACK4GC_01835, partial [Paracoccaceae bacterium]
MALSGVGEGGGILIVELYRSAPLARRVGISERAAAIYFGVSRTRVKKIMGFSVLSSYRRKAGIWRLKLDGFTGFIDQWLLEDLDLRSLRSPHDMGLHDPEWKAPQGTGQPRLQLPVADRRDMASDRR